MMNEPSPDRAPGDTIEATMKNLDLCGFTENPEKPGMQPNWNALLDLLRPWDYCKRSPYDQSPIGDGGVPAAVYGRLAQYLSPEKLALAFFNYFGLDPLRLLRALGAPAAMLFGVLAEAARKSSDQPEPMVNGSALTGFDDIVFLFTQKGWTVYLRKGVKIVVAGFNMKTGGISDKKETYAICANEAAAQETFSKLKCSPGALTLQQYRQVP